MLLSTHYRQGVCGKHTNQLDSEVDIDSSLTKDLWSCCSHHKSEKPSFFSTAMIGAAQALWDTFLMTQSHSSLPNCCPIASLIPKGTDLGLKNFGTEPAFKCSVAR